jgi:hypothetical protein
MSVIDEYDPLNESYIDSLRNLLAGHGYVQNSTKLDHPEVEFYKHPKHDHEVMLHTPTSNWSFTAGYNQGSLDDGGSDFDSLESHLHKVHSKKESNDDDSAEDAEGKDGDNDGESSAEIGNSEDKGFDNKFNKRYKGRAFGHALRVHRSKEEESMSSVIERAKQILGLSNGMSEAFSKMPGGGIHLPVNVSAHHHTTDMYGSDVLPGVHTVSNWSSRAEIPTGKVTYTKHQHPLVSILVNHHNVGEDTPWVKMPKLDYSYLHSTTASYKGVNKGVALAVSRRDPSHRVLLNHDSTVDLHHLKDGGAERLNPPVGVGRNEGSYRTIYSPIHVNKTLQHHFGHSDFDFYKPDYSKSKPHQSNKQIQNKSKELNTIRTGRIQPSVTVGDKFLSTVHSNRHNEIRDNIHAHVNDVMGHINHMLSGGTPQHGEYGRHPSLEKLRNSLNALEDMHDEIRKTHYKGWRGDSGRDPMTVDQLLRTRKKATQAATGSDRY